jgi:hypothetical protein
VVWDFLGPHILTPQFYFIKLGVTEPTMKSITNDLEETGCENIIGKNEFYNSNFVSAFRGLLALGD